MVYAKIDEQGNVLEFPYRIDEIVRITNQELPTDVIEVDSETLKPNANWDEKLLYDNLVNNSGVYQLSYTVSNKFDTTEQKKKAITGLVSQYKKQNKATFKSKVLQLKSNYPDDEILSWDAQVKEANDFLNGADMTGSLIETISIQRGITLEEISNRILLKRQAFNNSYGAVLGKFQKNEDILESIDLEDETTYSSIDLYGWE